MDKPQYINNVTFTGVSSPPPTPSDINPGSPGVDFITSNPSIIIPLQPGIKPILAEVSVPNTNTNVNQITVIVTSPNGRVIVNETSTTTIPNTVNQFPVTPFPEDSTITIIVRTPNNEAPQNVTISVIACYTPSITTTTIVTSGTVPPSISGSTLTISSSTTQVTQGPGNKICDILLSFDIIRSGMVHIER